MVTEVLGAVLAADNGKGELHRCRISDINGSAIVVEHNSELSISDTDVSTVDGVALLAAKVRGQG